MQDNEKQQYNKEKPWRYITLASSKKLFDASGNGGELEMYPNVHHGFAFPQRKIYDKQAAERHWERLIALYRRRLG